MHTPHGRTEAAAARERELEKAKRATQKRYHELITQVRTWPGWVGCSDWVDYVWWWGRDRRPYRPVACYLFSFPITIATLYIYVTNEQATAEKNVVEDKCRRLQGEAKVRTYIPKIAGKTDRYIDTATTTDDD